VGKNKFQFWKNLLVAPRGKILATPITPCSSAESVSERNQAMGRGLPLATTLHFYNGH